MFRFCLGAASRSLILTILLLASLSFSSTSFAESSETQSRLGYCLSLLRIGIVPYVGPFLDMNSYFKQIREGDKKLRPRNFSRTAIAMAAYVALYAGLSTINNEVLVTNSHDFARIGAAYQRVEPKRILFIDAMYNDREIVDNEYAFRTRQFPQAKIDRLLVKDPDDMLEKLAELNSSGSAPYDTIEIAAHGNSGVIGFGTSGNVYDSDRLRRVLGGAQFTGISTAQTTLWFYSCKVASDDAKGRAQNTIIPDLSRALLPHGGVIIGSYRIIQQSENKRIPYILGYGNMHLMRLFYTGTRDSGIADGAAVQPKVAVWTIDEQGILAKVSGVNEHPLATLLP